MNNHHQIQEKFSYKPCISLHFELQVLQVEIETQRLFIRSYREKDLENCVSLYGDPLITQYFDYGGPRSRDEVLKLIYEKGSRYFSKGKPFGLFSIFHKKDMVFIGQIDLIPTEEPGVVEIGFILRKQFHNQGLCTEAIKALMFDYVDKLNYRGLVGLPIRKVIATTHPQNEPSKRVLENVGMKLDKFQERFGSPRLWYSYIPESRLNQIF